MTTRRGDDAARATAAPQVGRLAASSPTRGASRGSSDRGLAVHRLVDRAGRDRGAVLVQRRAVSSTFQGFSLQWYEAIWNAASEDFDDSLLPGADAEPQARVAHDADRHGRSGWRLAIGLARWRGRGAGAANFLMLFPLVTPEIVMGASLFLVFANLFTFMPLGTTAQVLGHVTFSISYVVIVTCGRLFAIGREYEEAAMDLGASPAAGAPARAAAAARPGDPRELRRSCSRSRSTTS